MKIRGGGSRGWHRREKRERLTNILELEVQQQDAAQARSTKPLFFEGKRPSAAMISDLVRFRVNGM